MKFGIFFLSLLLSALASAETLYVHSVKAPLFETASFSGNALAVLTRGTAVELVSKQSRWLEVEYEGAVGWVSVLLVKAQPPKDGLKVIGSEQVELEGDARMRASAVATAGATRGLVEGQESDNLAFDFEELLMIEAISISDDELNEFSQPIFEETE